VVASTRRDQRTTARWSCGSLTRSRLVQSDRTDDAAEPASVEAGVAPELQRWVDDMRAIEPWLQLGKKATAL